MLIEAQLSAGEWTDPDRGKVKLADYAAAWITQRPGLRPRSADNYRWLLKKHIDAVPGRGAGRQAVNADDPRVAGGLLSNGVSVSTAAKAYRLLARGSDDGR